MSRGFVREGDQEEPVVIPQRAVLPDHVINYVTPSGRNQLREELDVLEKDFAGIVLEDEKERRREQTLVLGKIKLLKERINSARPILLEEQPQDEIRFGATVKIKNLNLTTYQVLTITGVDEANVAKGKIAFTTPIARAIIGAKAGDTVDFKLGGENRPLHIEYIKYGSGA
jgi:transcription elongation factor GreB